VRHPAVLVISSIVTLPAEAVSEDLSNRMLTAAIWSLVSPPPPDVEVAAGVAPEVAAEVAAVVAADVAAVVAPAVGEPAGFVAAPSDAGVIFGVRTGVGSLSLGPPPQDTAAPLSTRTDNKAAVATSRFLRIIRSPSILTPAGTSRNRNCVKNCTNVLYQPAIATTGTNGPNGR
jgi:hypothetical protein